MSNVLNYCVSTKESKLIESEMRNAAALVSEDDWQIFSCNTLESYADMFKEKTKIDISCFDVTPDSAIEMLEDLRKKDKSAMLVLISDVTVSPLKYMKPALMAGALILKPLNSPVIFATFKDVLKEVCSSSDDEDDSDKFCVETKSGQKFVSFDKILYFEAREKKIFLNTPHEEIAFYSSLELLEQSLPENFVRVHRGFIINAKKISQIVFAENIIYLGDDIIVPLSRSFKPVLKEMMENSKNGR